jgi:two-component system OmpR family sensor kinase
MARAVRRVSAEPVSPTEIETGEPPARSPRRSDQLIGAVWHPLRSLLSSYRLRLLGWFVGLLALGTLATVLVVGEVILQGTDERVRADLIQESQEFENLIGGTDPETGQPFGTDVARIFDVYLDRNVPARNEMIITFVDGELHGRSQPAPILALEHEQAFVDRVATTSVPATGRYDSAVGAVDYLAVPVLVDGESRGVFVVAAFLDAERAEQDDILRAVTTVGVILLLIGSVLAWRLADRVLAPVRRTAATARSINESDLQQRVEVRGHDEVADLARTFNEMLDRVETAIEEQRRFMDDAGHELRTPLTIARGHLELADHDNPEELRRTIDLVLDEVDRMTRLVYDLVLLAAATRPDFVRRTPLQARRLSEEMFDKARVLGDRNWQLQPGRDAEFFADRHSLTQAILQLAQNAVQHTQEGDLIELGVDATEAHVRLWVRDTGHGIPPEEQPHLFRRFYRVETQGRGTSGTGLGLSIVQAIAEAHGGRVELESRPGAGATFTLVIPRLNSDTSDRSDRDHGDMERQP